MKLFKAILAILIMSTSSALACDGFYMGLRAGITNHNIGEVGVSATERFKVDNNNLMAAIALGYRYGNWRAEGEFTWREESVTTDSAGTDVEFSTESYMANVFYDLTPYSRYTPFLQAGLGLTNITVKETANFIGTSTYEETNFTWSVGGGVSAKLTNRWNVDVGYRFYNMGEIEEASVRNHEVYGGARYVF